MQDLRHLLQRTGFGPRPPDVERVEALGPDRYIEQQLHPTEIDDHAVEPRLSSIPSIRMTTAEILEHYPRPQRLLRQLGLPPNGGFDRPQKLLEELQAQKIIRAVHSGRQLQEVMTNFWFNHFNVFWGKNANRWLTTGFEMNAIRPNVFGKFKDLLIATAKSPAMLFYLDNYLSSSPDSFRVLQSVSNRRAGINENYARELMELHTLGVDGGYGQRDVQEVARAFTGWSIEAPQRSGEFVFRPRMHDNGEKVVLGHKINDGGMKDGEAVIDLLARHPSTARFISTKLVRRFVSDDPPRSLVDQVAAVYKRTGGDIPDMLRAIFKSHEFWAPQAVGAKIKTPFELAVSAIRALNGATDGSRPLAQMITRMGQPLYQCQPPSGFPDRSDYWMNTGAVLERLNFIVALTTNRIPGTTVTFDEPVKSVALKLGAPEFQRR